MDSSKRNMIIYGVIAIAVIAIAAYVLSGSSSTKDATLSFKMLSSGQAYPYQTAQFEILVNNTGSSAISGLTVTFYVNGTPYTTYKVSLPPKKVATILPNYTYSGFGNVSFSAIADPGYLFDFQNRSALSSPRMDVRILPPQVPDVYAALPQNGINKTQSFSLTGQGAFMTSVISDSYNVTLFNQMYGPVPSIMEKVIENLYPYTATVDGSYTSYSNGTVAYASWMQGSALPPVINYVIGTFHLPTTSLAFDGTGLNMTRANANTSICTFYQGGWSKIYALYNASSQQTCLSVLEANYSSPESATLKGIVNGSDQIFNSTDGYLSRFSYTNSTILGTGLALTQSNFSARRMFYQNSGIGYFTEDITKSSSPLNLSGVSSFCNGIVSNANNTHICSEYVSPKSGTANGFGLVRTSEITPNYTFTLYSLVNSSEVLTAHQNAVQLISALNFSSTAQWHTPFVNSCTLFNQPSLNCSVVSFNTNNETVSLNITNRFSSPITINQGGCYFVGYSENLTIGQSIGAGASQELSMKCITLPIPVVAAQNNFILMLNYTIGGSPVVALGEVNITSSGFS